MLHAIKHFLAVIAAYRCRCARFVVCSGKYITSSQPSLRDSRGPFFESLRNFIGNFQKFIE
ncbi:hypothetical protein A3462_15165 [Enterobacter bugandensis]|nr:hypothetical protein A3462_15165 [Enterobacter bugandensis]PJD07000.1 hypothetical protein B9Q19_15640 [Enterobacter bugandensis]